MSDYVESLRARIRAFPIAEPSAPWSASPQIAVGGLREVAVGVVNGQDLVMTISDNGRGVFDGQGNRLARDRQEPSEHWLDEFALDAAGIGPLQGERFRIAGLSGGGLPVATRDGWTVARLPVDWPDELVILEPPGSGALWPGHQDGCLAIFAHDAMELRVAGFSPSGRTLILGTAADLRLFARDLPPGHKG